MVAYNPKKTPNENDFIAGYTNLALDAQSWTLAAPGTFVSALPDNGYGEMSGTSMAAPVVSGAAALVQEAFPFLGGKQIADVLFSTAFKKDELDLPAYMIQDDGEGNVRFLYFTDNSQHKSKETALTEAHLNCSEVTCLDVTFEDVFGQGLLNVGDAVNGPKYFDEERLSPEDYDDEKKQYFYTVDTVSYNGEWSNGISEKLIKNEEESETENEENKKSIGLRKLGEGTLTLSGNNTFTGTSVVEKGTLVLKGTMSAPVAVEGGTLSVTAGTMKGSIDLNAGKLTISGGTVKNKININDGTFSMTGGSLEKAVKINGGSFSMSGGEALDTLTVKSGASFSIDGGTLNSVENTGTSVAGNATVNGDIANTGTFTIKSHVSGQTTSQGDFQISGTFTNNSALLLNDQGGFTGTLNNNAMFQTSGTALFNGRLNNKASGRTVIGGALTVSQEIQNEGILTGNGTINGNVNNLSQGSVGTSLTIAGTLTSAGGILLEESENAPLSMNVNTLNITGGKFVFPNGNKTYHDGETYTVVHYSDTLTGFDNLEQRTKLSDYIVAIPVMDEGNRTLNAKISYISMSEASTGTALSADQRKIIQIMDKMYLERHDNAFNRFYYYSTEEVKKRTDQIRNKSRPVQSEQLPLTKVMSSQIYAHLFTNNLVKNASEVRQQHVPMQRYQGRYYRGRSGGNAAKSNKVWGQFLGGTFKEDGKAELDQKDMTTHSAGAMVGYDHEFSDTFLLGLTAGAASATLKQDENEIRLRDYRAGFYTASRFGQFTFNTVAMGGLQKFISERILPLPGKQEFSKAKYNGYSAEFDANLGYDFMRVPYRNYSFYVRSYLSANVNYIHQDAYKEEGDSFLALGVSEAEKTSVSVSPGLTLGYTFSRTVLTADISYQRMLTGGNASATSYFLADPDKTKFSSLPIEKEKNYFNAGLGLKTDLTDAFQMNLWAGGRFSQRTKALNFSATFSYAF